MARPVANTGKRPMALLRLPLGGISALTSREGGHGLCSRGHAARGTRYPFPASTITRRRRGARIWCRALGGRVVERHGFGDGVGLWPFGRWLLGRRVAIVREQTHVPHVFSSCLLRRASAPRAVSGDAHFFGRRTRAASRQARTRARDFDTPLLGRVGRGLSCALACARPR